MFVLKLLRIDMNIEVTGGCTQDPDANIVFNLWNRNRMSVFRIVQ